MNRDTIETLEQVLQRGKQEELSFRLAGIMPEIRELMGITLQPTDLDKQFPNYTSIDNLLVATNPDECKLPSGLQPTVLKGLQPDAKDSDVDKVTDKLTDYLFSKRVDEMRPDHAFVSILQLFSAIDGFKVGKFGLGSPANRANHLAYGTLGKFIDFIPRNEEAFTVYSGVISTLKLLMGVNENFYGWWVAKAENVVGIIRTYNLDERKMFADDEKFPNIHVSPEKVQATDALLKSALSLKGYGIKMCTTPGVRGGSLALDDIEQSDTNSQFHFSTYGRDKQPLMYAFSLPGDEYAAQTLERDFKEETFGENGKLWYFMSTTNWDQVIILANDGELYVDSACVVSLKDMYDAHGKLGLYELTRAEVVAHFADQVMPATLVSSIPKFVKMQRGMPAEEVINNLILPRINRIKDIDHDVLDEEEFKESEDKSNIIIREHDVIYHTRWLQPGQRPSPRAIQLAKEKNVTIPEGKTFVKAHTRGNGPRVVGHIIAGKTVEELIF